jgi:hypothetical protein
VAFGCAGIGAPLVLLWLNEPPVTLLITNEANCLFRDRSSIQRESDLGYRYMTQPLSVYDALAVNGYEPPAGSNAWGTTVKEEYAPYLRTRVSALRSV